MTAVTSDPVVEEAPDPDAAEHPGREIAARFDHALSIKPTQKAFTPDQVAVMKSLGWDIEDMTPAEVQYFGYFCAANNVDPLLRQAMPLKTKDGIVPIMMIAGMRTRAEDTGDYEGLTRHFEFQDANGDWHEGWPDVSEEPVACRIGVYRRGWREPVEGSVRTAEAKVYEPRQNEQGRTEWVLAERWEKLIRMLKVAAEADGLRRAFPSALSGFYTYEEMARVKREREEAHLRKEASEARAARRAAYEAAQGATPKAAEPNEPSEPSEVVEGVIVEPREPMTIGQTMAAARDLIDKARTDTPAPPAPEQGEEEAPASSEHEAPRPDLPEQPAELAAPEVPADLPLTEEQRVGCLRAELGEQASIYGISVDLMVRPYTAIYEGDPLSTWDSEVLLSVVAFWRPRVVKRLEALGRWEEAAAYREVGSRYVDQVDVLFGRTTPPVGDDES